METAEKFSPEEALDRLLKLDRTELRKKLRRMRVNEVFGLAEKIMKNIGPDGGVREVVFDEAVESYYDRDACLLAGADYCRINDEDVARLLILNYRFYFRKD